MTLTCPYCGADLTADTGREMSAKVRSHTVMVHGRTDTIVMTEAIVKLEAAAEAYPYEQYLEDIGKSDA